MAIKAVPDSPFELKTHRPGKAAPLRHLRRGYWGDIISIVRASRSSNIPSLNNRLNALLKAWEDGRLTAGCHATQKEDFEGWRKRENWQVESITPITPIKYVAKTGSVWTVT